VTVARNGLLRALGAAGVLVLLAAPSPAHAAGNLYVSDWTQGAVSMFSVGAGGLLTQQGTGLTSTGSRPAGVAISPNGQDLYVANENQGTVSTYSIGAGGALTEMGAPVASGNTTATTDSEPYGIAVSPNGLNLYVANYLSGTVSTFSVGAGGALIQQGTGISSGSSGPSWVAVAPDGENLYVTNYDAGTVSTFSIGAGGALTPEGSPVNTGSGDGSSPENLVISPDGEYLYVSNHADGTVSTFFIGAGGALTLQGTPVFSGSGAGSGPQGLAMSPGGENLYVANEADDTVSSFSVGAGGALTAQASTSPISGTADSSKPFGIAVSPAGSELYVASFALGAVSAFSVGSGGALALQGAPVPSGSSNASGAYQLAVSPDQGPSAAYSASVSPTEPEATFNAQPSTAGSTAISTYAWQFGDGTTATGAQVSHAFAAPGTYTVTLTLTDADSCSTSGPYTGQSPDCQADAGASTSRTITVPAPPTASRASITGIAADKPKLAFTLAAGALAPPLSTIAVTPPRGLRFSSAGRDLTRHITVIGSDGKHERYAAAVRHGELTITLASPQPGTQVTIASPELSAVKRLVEELAPRKHHKPRKRGIKLSFRLGLTDAGHDTVTLLVKTTAH